MKLHKKGAMADAPQMEEMRKMIWMLILIAVLVGGLVVLLYFKGYDRIIAFFRR